MNNKIYFDTLGCAKNQVDTKEMVKLCTLAGYKCTENPNDANLIVINTCAFIEAASYESIETFFDYYKSFPKKPILVTGCLVSRYKQDLENTLEETNLFLECNEEKYIVKKIKNILDKNKEEEYVNKDKVFTYIKISDGCNRFCSYCTIPYIRGRYKSESYENIKQNIEETKAKEIVLVAQDCGSWGSDIGKNLSWLLSNLAKDFKDKYFRVLYIQPDAINEELINTFKNNNNILNYFDIPIQHTDSELLKSMNRKPLDIDLFKNIKKEIPNAVLRTTLIVGYPNESEKMFNNLCDYIENSLFDYIGVFKYSQEDGTRAAKLDKQINEKTKDERFNKLRDICDKHSLSRIDKMIGNNVNIIIEGKEEDRLYGRSYMQAPDVDGVVYIPYNKNLKAGDIVSVKIESSELYDLVGSIIEVD